MNNGHMFLLYMGVYITILKLGAVIVYGWGRLVFCNIYPALKFCPPVIPMQWNFVPHLTLCTQIMSPLTLCVHWNVAPHLIKLCALKFGLPSPCKKTAPTHKKLPHPNSTMVLSVLEMGTALQPKMFEIELGN